MGQWTRSYAIPRAARRKANTLDDKLRERIESLAAWLAENAPEIGEMQRHLDKGSAERAYWHFGYLIALRDIVARIGDQDRKLN